jgi:hypothetical protein
MIDLGFVPLVPLPVAFTVASLVLGLNAIGGLFRYRDAFNPLVFFAIYEGLFQTLLSAWIALSILSISADDVSRTLVLATLYFMGTAVGFLPVRFFGSRLLIRRWLLRVKLMAPRNIIGTRFHLFFVAIVFLLVFLALMVASGAGTLWITNPRMAYQNFRAGSGFLFLLVQWTSVSGLLIYYFGRPQTMLSSLKALAIYMPIAYFTGSKASIVSGLVLWSAFCNFSIRSICHCPYFSYIGRLYCSSVNRVGQPRSGNSVVKLTGGFTSRSRRIFRVLCCFCNFKIALLCQQLFACF